MEVVTNRCKLFLELHLESFEDRGENIISGSIDRNFLYSNAQIQLIPKFSKEQNQRHLAVFGSNFCQYMTVPVARAILPQSPVSKINLKK